MRTLAERGVFHPRSQFAHLAHDHVAFDRLAARPAFETLTTRALVQQAASVAVRGPVGAGKSSLITSVCAELPDTHVALRVPIVGADDPTSVSVLAALTLSDALATIEIEDRQRRELELARADQVERERTPGTLGAKLGGGPIPAEVAAESGTLSQQLNNNRLAGERLAGLDRLIDILVARGRAPIFVLEDTEAAVGGRDAPDRSASISWTKAVTGPAKKASMDPPARGSAPGAGRLGRRRARPVPRLGRVPTFPDAHAALAAIIGHRLAELDDAGTAKVLGDDALDALVAFYDEAQRSLRLTLAALQSAVDHAAELSANTLRAAHVRLGTDQWRSHVGAS